MYALTTPCPYCGYQGASHCVGCDRPWTPAQLAERAKLEAIIAEAGA